VVLEEKEGNLLPLRSSWLAFEGALGPTVPSLTGFPGMKYKRVFFPGYADIVFNKRIAECVMC